MERFRTIAKRLVDDHSAQLFTTTGLEEDEVNPTAAYYSHLDSLGRELNQQAEAFMSTSAKSIGTELRAKIWDTCKKYIEQFTRRNQPGMY